MCWDFYGAIDFEFLKIANLTSCSMFSSSFSRSLNVVELIVCVLLLNNDL